MSDSPAPTYRELGPLAEGGMAELFAAEREDGTAVVIKRIRPAFVFDETYRALFHDEGQVQGCLCHPNVVQLLDRGEDDRGPYLVFERIDGTDLGIVLEAAFDAKRPLDVAQVIALAIPLFEALACVHQACADDGACLDVIHRDISPGNILLSETGEVKLADFGVAKSALKTQHTVVGEMKGKFAYMAPEQTRGGDVCPKADLFAAGVVLHECLTATQLFDGPSDVDVVQAVRELEVAPPSESNPDVPRELDALVLSLLAKDAAERPASAQDAVDALEDIAAGLCLDTGRKRHVARLATAHPRVLPTDGDVDAVSPRRRTQRVMGAAAAAAVVTRPTSRAPLWWGATAVVLVAASAVFIGTRPDTTVPTDVIQLPPFPAATSADAAPVKPRVDSANKLDPTTLVDQRPNAVLASTVPPSSVSPLALSPALKTVPRSTPVLPSALKRTSTTDVAVRTKVRAEPARVKASSTTPATKPVKATRTIKEISTVVQARRAAKARAAEAAKRLKVASVVASDVAPKDDAPKDDAPTAPAGFGKIYLAAEPWARVFVDGSPLGQNTPVVGLRLAAGRHVIKLENPVVGLVRTVIVDVPKDGEIRRFVDLSK